MSLALSKEEIFTYHLGGKIGLALLKPLMGQRDLSAAYTPGVAQVCLATEKDENFLWTHTAKGNAVAVMTDGSAVLGLGDIGAKASIPVMEGKAALFKAFANINGWPVPLEGVRNEEGKSDVDKFVETAKRLSCMYGGINLEDIAAPACFLIEKRLEEELDIPVFHDDQWGTAIIVLAAVNNYCTITGKAMEKLSVVINGAGAAGLRIAEMLKSDGVKQCILCDSKGVLSISRSDLNPYKRLHAVESKLSSLKGAMKDADIFIGVSVADCVTEEMVKTMANYPAIFAMANPIPEILPEKVAHALQGRKYVMATGRSDFPNQVNNVLGFPFIFRGALDVRARKITMGMKKAASKALAQLAQEKEIPKSVQKAYGKTFEFGPNYLIPTPFDPRLIQWEAKAVAKAAIAEGVSK